VKFTSPVILSLCGILKDIVLVVISSIMFNSIITGIQIIGYAISLVGLLSFRMYRQDPKFYNEKIDEFRRHLIHSIMALSPWKKKSVSHPASEQEMKEKNAYELQTLLSTKSNEV
jgi:hypothetical protein